MQSMENKMNRRKMGLLLGGLGIASAQAQEKKPGTIHFDVDYKAKAERIYQALLDAKQFSAFSGLPAEIEPRPGGAFKLFAGQIEGRNVELVVNQRVVQAWRPASWPAGEYSIARFELVARDAGTRIVFDHIGFSEDKREGLTDGWREHYWEPLHKYLNA
jgi:activator of HSP90 ATPase